MAVFDSGRNSSVMSEVMSESLFELPATTWTVIQSCCPDKEASEVKRVIGHSLIEEACDLHAEASMLLEIWRQMREEADPGRSHDDDTPLKLADPPGVRDKLVQEIKFLVSYLQKRDSTSPVLAETITSHAVNYALTSHDHPNEHPSTTTIPTTTNTNACTRSSTHSLHRPPSSSCTVYHCDTPSANSNSSSMIDLLEDTCNTLSIQEVDRSISNLRLAVREEIEQRHHDIQLLQGYIDNELSYHNSIPAPPTIKELQSVSQKLEKQLLREQEKEITINNDHIPSSSDQTRLDSLEEQNLMSVTDKRIHIIVPPLPPSTQRPCRTPVKRASKVVRKSLDQQPLLSPSLPSISPPPISPSRPSPLSPSRPATSQSLSYLSPFSPSRSLSPLSSIPSSSHSPHKLSLNNNLSKQNL